MMAETFTPEDEVSVALSVMVEYPVDESESMDLLLAILAVTRDVADRAQARLIELGRYR